MNISTRTFLSAVTVSFALLATGEGVRAQGRQDDKTFTVVIDPGHGGKDPGAPYGRLLEKNLNLDIALALGKLIDETMPDVEVILTRSDDRAVALDERGAIANRADADLFLSIHGNSSNNTAASGTETLVMGTSKEKNEESLRIAMRENEVIKYEDGYKETYEGFDPSSAESYIMFQLQKSAHFDRSLQFSRMLQSQYSETTPMRDRGAKQANLVVLWKTAMPAVLTEVGFGSNDADRKYIFSQTGQEKVVHAIYGAFREYKNMVQGEKAATAARISTVASQSPVISQSTATVKQPRKTPTPFSGTGFYVQLAATRTRIPVGDRRFSGLMAAPLENEGSDGWFRYYLGPFGDLSEATACRDRTKRGGVFKDAFVVALDGTAKISIEQARKQIAAQ